MAIRLDSAHVRWWVTGGVAAAFHGSDRRPGDLDVECAMAHAERAGRALGVVMLPGADARVSSSRACTRLAGVDIDISAGLGVRGPGGSVGADDNIVFTATVLVEWMGRELRVAHPGEAVARATALGDDARLSRARAVRVPIDDGYVARRLGWANAAR